MTSMNDEGWLFDVGQDYVTTWNVDEYNLLPEIHQWLASQNIDYDHFAGYLKVFKSKDAALIRLKYNFWLILKPSDADWKEPNLNKYLSKFGPNQYKKMIDLDKRMKSLA